MTSTHQLPGHTILSEPDPPSGSWVFAFSSGGMDQKDLLGGKGANLAEMASLGLPVPPGFIVSTEACRSYLALGHEPSLLGVEIGQHLDRLEGESGRRLGDDRDPLLVSVRSGAKFSMPGMMETVLNIGLNDAAVEGLARQSGDARFAWDSYRRFVQMYGATVMGVDAAVFADDLARLKEHREVSDDLGLDAEDLELLVATYRASIRAHTGSDVPQDPREQLQCAVLAVFDSWNTDRAVLYRRREHIPHDLGTAVTVQTMVFGNRGAASGSGVCFTRDPATGRVGVYGDYLSNAQGEDVVAGIRNTVPLADLAQLDRPSYEQLLEVMRTLEGHFRDLCDIEFTIEEGRLWILQTRVGKRTPEAAFRTAVAMVDEGLIDLDEALGRVTGTQLANLMFPRFDPTQSTELLATGTGASPGAAVGRIALDSATAEAWAQAGDAVVLVRHETTPDDLRGMVAANGILTARGGKTSHAAVVARGMGRTCVCGAETLHIDTAAREVTFTDGPTLQEGETVSVDGATGEVFRGSVPVVASPVVEYFEGTAGETGNDTGHDTGNDLVTAVATILTRADRVRRLRVHANADTGVDAARARRFGAEGIGLCRTEHMFLGERRQLVEDLILAEGPDAQDVVLARLQVLQRADFVEILEAMDGLPVTVRLIDPPLHEFLPDLTELSVRIALAERDGAPVERDHRLLDSVRRLHEQNPMLGLRGVRLGIVIPGLFRMQARALLEAAADRCDAGGDPRPEIMVPLVASSRELALVRQQLLEVVAGVTSARGVDIPCPIGTMIEVPRAALTADRIAESAEFFSFGTNDLTQMTWGFSRDDVEAAFFATYLEQGILDDSPFETIDVEGVGSLLATAIRLGREARPGIHVGVCGEHGGDPASIHFFDAAGVDHVSCSPFRLPVARLEGARAVLARPRPSPGPTPTAAPTVADVVALSCRAPSVHNTQPWSWRVSGSSVELSADPTRRLLASDPRGRHVIVSCGAALHHAQVAALGLGWQPVVARFPAGRASAVLARIELTAAPLVPEHTARLQALRERRTDRRRSTSWPVPDGRLAKLAATAEQWGAIATTVTHGPQRSQVEALLDRAFSIQAEHPEYAREQASWVDHGTYDGVPSAVVPDRAQTRAGHSHRFGTGLLEDATLDVDANEGLIVLGTLDDDPAAWLRVGEAMSALWLDATAAGLSVVPLSQPIEVPETRRALQRVLLSLAVPQVLLRIGWPSTTRTPLPPVPRRPLDDVLTDSSTAEPGRAAGRLGG